jgi:NAD(P)-dependent dehydrogenase (short-subunit alcohol dehydrogenase family)
MHLKGKTAVVMGASAPGGTGWAIAEGLAEAGAKVIVAARNLASLETLAEKTGGHAIACDLGDRVQVEALAREVERRFGRIDIAVNSAGLPVIGMIADTTPEALQQALDVNYLGAVHFIKNTAAIMNDNGSIVMITSYSATQPIEPHFAYACAKAATDCLVKYAAIEYGRRGIRVNSIQPGPIKTDMAAHLYAIPGAEDVFAREVPLGRVGLPRDYADAVLWLAGPCYVSGLNLPVNGGNQLTRMARMDELPMGFDSYDADRAA